MDERAGFFSHEIAMKTFIPPYYKQLKSQDPVSEQDITF
jgi:hypothetical protein